MAILAIRISGQCKLNKKNAETLKRLKLHKKYSARIVDEKDKVLVGMLDSAKDEIAFGKVETRIEKEISQRADEKGIVRLHPPIGGFKKSTKGRYPRGIRGNNPDIAKFAERMLV